MIALAAAVISLKARGDGKQSAHEARRSADAAEGSLTLQREEADARRRAEGEAARPRPDIDLLRDGRNSFRLVSSGTAPVEGLRIVEAGEPAQTRDAPDGVTLEPGDAHRFLILTSTGWPMPEAIRVTWDGRGEPKVLTVAP